MENPWLLCLNLNDMKKIAILFTALMFSLSSYSCRETTEEKTEEAIDAIGEDIEEGSKKAAEDIEKGAEKVEQEIHEEMHETDDQVEHKE